MPKLAINGGPKVRNIPFPDQETYGDDERTAIWNHLNNEKLLSNYRGNWIKEFWGGEEVKSLEKEFAEKFNVKYAIAVNSCTSALQLACIAIGLKEGDEVIVTPWSMSCSATAPLICGATPVFADIEKNYFCLDYHSVASKITEKTKAIIAVDLFGQPFDPALIDLCRDNNIKIIEDAAQAIGSTWNQKYAGTLGDIGCFSFTQGKHITSGEGGMLVTNDYDLAMKLALLRNHAEAVVSANDNCHHFLADFGDLYGFNMRMTELQAVILKKQLNKLNCFLRSRAENSFEIGNILEENGIAKRALVRKECTHSYYVDPYIFNDSIGVSRDLFIEAVKAELTGERSRPDRPMLGCGYIRPLYSMPLFNDGRNHFDDYPVVEKLYRDDLFISMYHGLPLNREDIGYIRAAFEKVLYNIVELKHVEQEYGWHEPSFK